MRGVCVGTEMGAAARRAVRRHSGGAGSPARGCAVPNFSPRCRRARPGPRPFCAGGAVPRAGGRTDGRTDGRQRARRRRSHCGSARRRQRKRPAPRPAPPRRRPHGGPPPRRPPQRRRQRRAPTPAPAPPPPAVSRSVRPGSVRPGLRARRSHLHCSSGGALRAAGSALGAALHCSTAGAPSFPAPFSSRRRLSAPGAQTGHGSAPTLRAASPAAAARGSPSRPQPGGTAVGRGTRPAPLCPCRPGLSATGVQ